MARGHFGQRFGRMQPYMHTSVRFVARFARFGVYRRICAFSSAAIRATCASPQSANTARCPAETVCRKNPRQKGKDVRRCRRAADTRSVPCASFVSFSGGRSYPLRAAAVKDSSAGERSSGYRVSRSGCEGTSAPASIISPTPGSGPSRSAFHAGSRLSVFRASSTAGRFRS